jgi:hypothetical protein
MATNQNVNAALVGQIKQRYNEISSNEAARYYCAKHYRRLHYLLGIPAAVITALVSSSLFYFLQTNATTSQKIALASASALAAVLSSVQTFLQPLKTAEVNLSCGYRLYVLRLKLEEVLAGVELSTNEDIKKALSETTQKMELISASVPEIPTWIWRKYCNPNDGIQSSNPVRRDAT